MNAFTTNINSSASNIPSRISVCRPFNVELNKPIVELSYPKELLNTVNLESIDFSIVRYMAEAYANYIGTSLHLRLTGYTDCNNYRFESNQFIHSNSYRKLLFIMENGIPNVISDWHY